jgi:hypothetical protein
MKTNWKMWVWIIVLFVVVFGVLMSFVDWIPNRDLTKTRILVTEQRIRLFVEKNGKMPASLANLPLLPKRDNKTTDAWGRELDYKVEGNKVTLSSPGKPGAISERERGITITFDISKPLGATP